MSVNFKSSNIQKYKELSDSIKKNLEVTDNVIKEKEDHSSYYDNLPENLSKTIIEEVSKYNSKFVTSAHVALGEVAADIFKDNPEVETVSAEIGYFGKNDKIQSTIHKEKTYTNHLAKEGESKEVVKHLVFNTTINSVSNKGYGLKSIRNSMSEEFSSMFKS